MKMETRSTVLISVGVFLIAMAVSFGFVSHLEIPHTNQEDRAYYDSEGVFHDSVNQQRRLAAFVRDNHCTCIDHVDRGAQLDERTLKIVHPTGFSTYQCPGIQNKLHIDDNEVQP